MLFDRERDACGVGFVAHIKGERSRSIVDQGLEVLRRLSHRAAVGADPQTGDGAGILMQLPEKFFRSSIFALSSNCFPIRGISTFTVQRKLTFVHFLKFPLLSLKTEQLLSLSEKHAPITGSRSSMSLAGK